MTVAHRRRPRVPGADRRDVRPDPVRAARLADAGQRPGLAAAGELPVHARGDGDGARPPHARRRVRDVQLLPRRSCSSATRTRCGGVRPRARASTPGRPALGAREQAVLTSGGKPADIDCSDALVAGRDAPAPATDDHPFPYLRGRSIPDVLPVVAGVLILLASVVIVRLASGAPFGQMRPLRRPVLHGRGVPAAGDEERRAVRAAVRHDLVRELAGVRGHPAGGARRGGGRAPSRASAAGRAVRRAAGLRSPWRGWSRPRRSCRCPPCRGSSRACWWRSRPCSWRT